MFRCRYSFVEKANLVAIVGARMADNRVSFSQAADSVRVPLSTLYLLIDFFDGSVRNRTSTQSLNFDAF
jgi:hypothetical protein